ncbi:MAG: hypothetical protein U0R17_07295 [Acidimicrobiia bacterium]
MNEKEKKYTLVLAVVTGFLIIVFFAMIIWPKFQDMQSKADEATKAKNAAEAKLKMAKGLKPKQIDTRLRNLKARIPSTLALSNVINRITEKAQSRNLIWLQGTPVDESAQANTGQTPAPTGQTITIAPQLKRYDFTIIVKGQMPDFISFMSDITDKSIGRVMVINALDIQYKSDEGPTAIEATLKLQVIGWDKGADISSNGCTQTDGTTSDPNSPDCNQTNVVNSSKS